jgi:hypothetical protein
MGDQESSRGRVGDAGARTAPASRALGRDCVLRAVLSRPRARVCASRRPFAPSGATVCSVPSSRALGPVAARTRSLHQVSLALTSVARRGRHPPPNTLFVPPSRLPKPRSAGPLGRCGRRVATLVAAWQWASRCARDARMGKKRARRSQGPHGVRVIRVWERKGPAAAGGSAAGREEQGLAALGCGKCDGGVPPRTATPVRDEPAQGVRRHRSVLV